MKFTCFGKDITAAEFFDVQEKVLNTDRLATKIVARAVHYDHVGGKVTVVAGNPYKASMIQIIVTENGIRSIFTYTWDPLDAGFYKKVYPLKQGIDYAKKLQNLEEKYYGTNHV